MNPEDKIWTPVSILDWTEHYLQEKGVPTPRLDAELLLSHALGCERLELYLQFDRPLAADELSRFRELVRERGRRRPLAYLVGEVGFWNLTLAVRPGVLIPSPDSETLVEGILEAAEACRAEIPELQDEKTPLRVLELGCGSGALPLAAFSDSSHLCWVGTERSEEAMIVARENRARHAALQAPKGNALHLVLGDRFEAIAPGWQPHLVVGNPPYIPSGTIDRLMPEVSRAEPRLALDGGGDGGRFHRYMIAYAAGALVPGGRLLFEMGAEQGRAQAEVVRQTPGLRFVEQRKDLSGHPRVLHAERSDG